MALFTIVRITEEPDFVDGKKAPQIRIEWKAGDDGPFFDSFPKASFTELNARETLGAKADALERLRRGY